MVGWVMHKTSWEKYRNVIVWLPPLECHSSISISQTKIRYSSSEILLIDIYQAINTNAQYLKADIESIILIKQYYHSH